MKNYSDVLPPNAFCVPQTSKLNTGYYLRGVGWISTEFSFSGELSL